MTESIKKLKTSTKSGQRQTIQAQKAGTSPSQQSVQQSSNLRNKLEKNTRIFPRNNKSIISSKDTHVT